MYFLQSIQGDMFLHPLCVDQNGYGVHTQNSEVFKQSPILPRTSVTKPKKKHPTHLFKEVLQRKQKTHSEEVSFEISGNAKEIFYAQQIPMAED